MKPGPEQLRDWMDRRWPLSIRKARETAEHFDWDESFISQLLRGDRRPGLTNAIRIERECGIPVESWVSSELDEQEEAPVKKASKRLQDRA